jgi:hypothetical protein
MKPPANYASSGNEYARFSEALKQVLSVPHSVVKAQLDAEKQAKRQQPKRRAGHASRAKT